MGRRLVILTIVVAFVTTSCADYWDAAVLNQCGTTRTISVEWSPLPHDFSVDELPKYEVAPQTTTIIGDVIPPSNGGEWSGSAVLFVWTDDGVLDYGIEPSGSEPIPVIVPRSACGV